MTDKERKEPPSPHPSPSQDEQARQVVQEEIDAQRAIIERFKRKLN